MTLMAIGMENVLACVRDANVLGRDSIRECGGRVAGRLNSELEGEMRRGMPDRQWGGGDGR